LGSGLTEVLEAECKPTRRGRRNHSFHEASGRRSQKPIHRLAANMRTCGNPNSHFDTSSNPAGAASRAVSRRVRPTARRGQNRIMLWPPVALEIEELLVVGGHVEVAAVDNQLVTEAVRKGDDVA